MARALASPGGVLVILPALVIAAGVSVLLLGRSATRETAETMARHQLVAQATAVEHDVAFSLDQAEPVLATMKTLADVAMPIPDALTRLHDAMLKRPGVYNATIAFPVGAMWGAYYDDNGKLRVLESSVGAGGTRINYEVKNGQLVEIKRLPNTYDPRSRPYYEAAVKMGKTWLPPRVFSSSGKTGLTVTEPVYGPDNKLEAVISIDYDVAELSTFLRSAPLEGAHTVMFTADGTILANSSKVVPKAAQEKRLLRYTDFEDPSLQALFASTAIDEARGSAGKEPHFLRLATTDGDYLVSIAMVSGQRAGASSGWYLATLVPESSLLGPMHRLDRTSILASIVALAIALGVALLFSWNVVRMRRAVGAARAEARSAEARAKQLGSYQLVERLGLGGMGEVWRAEHQLLARRAAIKLVRNDLGGDAEHAALIQERFRREAQTLASMRSRHTIELYDYGVTGDGTFFYVMELLDGFDLSQLVKTWGTLPAARVISIMAQACSSLAEAHAAGLLHRDIKPANLVLCRAADEVDIVKVLDFGIVHRVNELGAPRAATKSKRPITAALGATGVTKPAKAINADAPTALGTKPTSRPPEMPGESDGNRLTVDGSVIGTPGYIAPEQAMAARLDPRGDVYSLGCVAWFLLTGGEVFSRSSVDDTLRAHVDAPIPELRPLVDGWLPVELEAVIVRCLAKDPVDRPAAHELAEVLRDIAIPDEHAWTRDTATAWWAEPRKVESKTPRAEEQTAVGAMLVADHEIAPRSEAETLVARPSNPSID